MLPQRCHISALCRRSGGTRSPETVQVIDKRVIKHERPLAGRPTTLYAPISDRADGVIATRQISRKKTQKKKNVGILRLLMRAVATTPGAVMKTFHGDPRRFARPEKKIGKEWFNAGGVNPSPDIAAKERPCASNASSSGPVGLFPSSSNLLNARTGPPLEFCRVYDRVSPLGAPERTLVALYFARSSARSFRFHGGFSTIGGRAQSPSAGQPRGRGAPLPGRGRTVRCSEETLRSGARGAPSAMCSWCVKPPVRSGRRLQWFDPALDADLPLRDLPLSSWHSAGSRSAVCCTRALTLRSVTRQRSLPRPRRRPRRALPAWHSPAPRAPGGAGRKPAAAHRADGPITRLPALAGPHPYLER